MSKWKPMRSVDGNERDAIPAGRSSRKCGVRRTPAVWLALVVLSFALPVSAQTSKHRIFVVSSYHREYLWSQDTQEGLCAGLIEHGFIDGKEQAAEFTNTDHLENSSSILKKAWMDTKRKSSKQEMAASTHRLMEEISVFSPDLVLLGDDNAAHFIGNQLIDTEIPVVFWGINGLPLRYGLLDSLERPGHNVTGICQPGYLEECLAFLHRIVPGARTFAILSDDSETGRSKAKSLQTLHASGKLPLQLVESVVTNRLEEWKSGAVRLQATVDAFFVLNHNSLKDENGRTVDQLEIGAWYLRHIRIPKCADQKQGTLEGMLCTCDDSGYNQGYEAVKLAHRILKKGEQPRDIAVRAPARGPFIVNRQRAEMLGIAIPEDAGVEQYIDKALALEEAPSAQGEKR